MILNIDPKASLGDFIMCTGIPHAFYKAFGEKTYITNKKMPLLWENNPYILSEPVGQQYNVVPNSPRDYMVYYPVRIFYDMTGLIVDRNLVHPDLYLVPPEKRNVILVNDQAGWPSRTGYRYYNDLIERLRELKYRIGYIRYTRFTNCFGKRPPATITNPDFVLEDISDEQLIYELLTCAIYIGYDSGLSQLAGALGTLYVALQAAVPPINTCHNSCIYHTEICAGYCRTEQCSKRCLETAPNINDEVIAAVMLNDYNYRLQQPDSEPVTIDTK